MPWTGSTLRVPSPPAFTVRLKAFIEHTSESAFVRPNPVYLHPSGVRMPLEAPRRARRHRRPIRVIRDLHVCPELLPCQCHSFAKLMAPWSVRAQLLQSLVITAGRRRRIIRLYSPECAKHAVVAAA